MNNDDQIAKKIGVVFNLIAIPAFILCFINLIHSYYDRDLVKKKYIRTEALVISISKDYNNPKHELSYYDNKKILRTGLLQSKNSNFYPKGTRLPVFYSDEGEILTVQSYTEKANLTSEIIMVLICIPFAGIGLYEVEFFLKKKI